MTNDIHSSMVPDFYITAKYFENLKSGQRRPSGEPSDAGGTTNVRNENRFVKHRVAYRKDIVNHNTNEKFKVKR